MPSFKRISFSAFAITAILLAPLTPVSASVGSLDPGDPAILATPYKRVVDKTVTGNKKGNEVGRCVAGSSKMNCSISRGKSATRSIQVDFGLTRGKVAGQLGISSSHSVTVEVGCSRTIKKGQALVAYSVGRQFRYRIESGVASVVPSKKTYSKWLSAFDPDKNGLYCVVQDAKVS